jgi:DNA-binding transcriptional ArsR family regulator
MATLVDWPLTSEEEDARALEAAVRSLQFLGDRNRLRILKLLTRGDTSVGALVDQLGLPQSLVSYHLRRLREAGLVRTRRQARQVCYAIDPSAWDAVVRPIRDLVTLD